MKTGWKFWAWIAAAAGIGLAVYTSYVAAGLSTGFDRDPCKSVAGTTTKSDPPKVVAVSPSSVGAAAGSDVFSVFASPICVTVEGLPAPQPDRKQSVILYLNGQAIPSVVGQIVDREKQLVLFHLERTAADANKWSSLIGAPPLTGREAGRVTLGVSAGLDESGPWARTDAAAITFLIYEPAAFWCGFGVLAAAVVVMILLAANTAILRDGGPGTSFSLGRCQMAWWLYLITASFIYIWLTTGEFSGVLSSDCLILLGISGTTGLASLYVPPPDGKTARTYTASTGFFADLLTSDLNGVPTVQLHRLQMVIWTLILGVVFVWEVYSAFRMPKFDTNLLIMMGISGSLYLGFKFKET